jgi:hypothetical protein
LLILTTTRRLALLLLVFLAWTPAAYAWSWPVQGPVLRPFVYDEAHPYASGQHRGVDIGVDSAGATVVAPAAGTISFAGTVPTNGRSVTIQTADGYSITLTHLGSIAVTKGATVAEQDTIGTVGPSGTPELDGPYVHLGIRVTADPNGYVDPLGLLPPAPAAAGDDTGSTTSQPVSSSASAAPPASKPASSAPKSTRVPGSGQSHARVHQHAQEPRSDASATRSRQRRARTSEEERPDVKRNRASVSTNSSRRPVVEPAAPRPIGFGAGNAIRSAAVAALARREPSRPVLGLACNLAAALVAVGAALSAGRRRRHLKASPVSGARVLHLTRPKVGGGRFSRAA